MLLHRDEKKDVESDSLTGGFKLGLGPLLASGVILIKLDLGDASGQLVSQNFYWPGLESSSYRGLARLPPAVLAAVAESARNGESIRIRV